jgi:iron complex outermembrane recepter protein
MRILIYTDSYMQKIYLLLILLCSSTTFAQIKGKVYDNTSKEPIPGVTVAGANETTMTDAYGRFSFKSANDSVTITAVGYKKQRLAAKNNMAIALQSVNTELQQVVVSANRTAEKRSDAPVAISTINKQTIEDTKAQRLDMLLNKVSGVNMINLGNEQHEMSIRQPMSTNNLFLYLEDGIPIRTSAVFNHNALLEMNMAAAKSMEVIKGPSSALYGAEAIGGAINVITQAPPAFTSGYVSAQSNDAGYRRLDAQVGTTVGKLGFIASGYYANQKDGPIQYSDFHKSASTYRLDYKIDDKTLWSNVVSYIDYFSDMYGDLDSTHFAQKNYSAQTFFTYRKVFAFRGRSTITHQWNENSSTSATFMYRSNSVIQNPSYSIGSYHIGNNAAAPFSADTATGNINENAFRSYGLIIQHVQKFKFLNSKLIIGTSAELNPQKYYQQFIWVQRENKGGLVNNVGYTPTDSMMANFKTLITNSGSYVDYDFDVVKGLRVSAALRYDVFQYNFINYLPGSKVTGGPSTITNYSKLAPKIGFTYNYKGIGFYGTYSQGYVPPQITQVFGKTTNSTYLKPQTFHNEEVGGWLSLLDNKLYIDYSAYLMNGTNEIISVRESDGTYQSENAGSTRHMGLEYGVNYHPASDWYFRVSASNAKHTFVNYVSSGVNYNGMEMADAPHFLANAEVTWKPHFLKGFRAALEWQHVGKYYMDNLQQYTYSGFDVFNARVGYQWKGVELWVNALNMFNRYYSLISSVSVSNGVAAYDYRTGDPRSFTVGIAYHFGK